jgi:hypothetical protein
MASQRPKHVATTNSVFDIMLELCFTDCSVDTQLDLSVVSGNVCLICVCECMCE